MTKVEGQEMKPKWYFTTREGFFLLGVFGLMALAVFLLSFFVWDIVQNFRIFGLTGDVVGTILGSSFLEILIIIALLVVLIYTIYRQTDWFFVNNRLWLVLGVIGVAIIASWVVVTTALNDETVSRPFEQAQEQTERLPLLGDRRKQLKKELEKRDIFVGRVEKIERQGLRSVEIVVSNPDKTAVFVSDKPGLRVREGQFVSVKFKPNGDKLEIVDIRPVRPGKRLP